MNVDAPLLTAESLDDGEAIEITGPGMGSLIITRTMDEATGQWIYVVNAADTANPVSLEA